MTTPSKESMEKANKVLFKHGFDAFQYQRCVEEIAALLDSQAAEVRKETWERAARKVEVGFLAEKPKLPMNTRKLIAAVEKASKRWDGNHPCELVDSLIPVFNIYAKQKAKALRAEAEKEK